MNKPELLNGVREEYRQWEALLNQIGETRMDQPGAAAEWSIKDIIAHLTGTWESIGVLVFHNELTLDVVDDFFSGPNVLSWNKLRPYVEHLRQRYARDTWSEWFQWLAERMMERESKVPVVPAYIAHRSDMKSFKRWLAKRG